MALEPFDDVQVPDGPWSARDLEQLQVFLESMPLGGGEPTRWKDRRFDEAVVAADLEPSPRVREIGARLDSEIRAALCRRYPGLPATTVLPGGRYFAATDECEKRRDVTQCWHVDKRHPFFGLWPDDVLAKFPGLDAAEWHVVLADDPRARGTEFALDAGGEILCSEERDAYGLDADVGRICESPVGRLHERRIGQVHRAPEGPDRRLCIAYMAVPPGVLPLD